MGEDKFKGKLTCVLDEEGNEIAIGGIVQMEELVDVRAVLGEDCFTVDRNLFINGSGEASVTVQMTPQSARAWKKLFKRLKYAKKFRRKYKRIKRKRKELQKRLKEVGVDISGV